MQPALFLPPTPGVIAGYFYSGSLPDSFRWYMDTCAWKTDFPQTKSFVGLSTRLRSRLTLYVGSLTHGHDPATTSLFGCKGDWWTKVAGEKSHSAILQNGIISFFYIKHFGSASFQPKNLYVFCACWKDSPWSTHCHSWGMYPPEGEWIKDTNMWNVWIETLPTGRDKKICNTEKQNLQ